MKDRPVRCQLCGNTDHLDAEGTVWECDKCNQRWLVAFWNMSKAVTYYQDTPANRILYKRRFGRGP